METNAARKRSIGLNNGHMEEVSQAYRKSWDLANMLIQLGETGSIDSPLPSPTEGDIRRDRRTTMQVKSPVVASSAIRSSATQSQIPPSTSEPANHSNLAAAAGWTASVGRNEFSQTQVELLRDILHSPSEQTPSEMVVDMPPRTPITPNQPLSPLSPTFHHRLEKENTSSPSFSRRASRTGFFNLKDIWRPSNKSQANPAGENKFHTTKGSLSPLTQSKPTAPPKSPARPTLAGMFRRTSTVSAEPLPKPPNGPFSRDSSASSLSDWDNFDAPFGRASPAGTQSAFQAGGKIDADQTIVRSESRKMLANLGVQPTAPRKSCVDQAMWTARASSDPPLTLMLTPDNLIPLLEQAKTAIKECEECLSRMREVSIARTQ